MNTTTHPVAPEELMAFLDGELSADRVQSVSAHMDGCAECRATADSLRNTSESAAKWTISAVPTRVEDRVLNATVGTTKLPEGGFVQSLRTLRRRRVFLTWGGATVVVLLIFLGLTAGRHLMFEPMAYRIDRERAEDSAQLRASQTLQEITRGGLTVDAESAVASKKDSGRFETKIPPSTPPTEPMIARTVSLSIIAKDFDGARVSLDKILARHNGYAASLNVSTAQGAARSIQASLRIPAAQLAAALAELKALGHVENETQNGEEVTQQHADLVARLKNSRETEQRLQAILQQRTGKISDVLEVEQEIARVRGEIEQMEAEQKALEHRVDFANIELKLSEEYKAQLDSPAPSASTQLHNASVNGYRNVVDTLLALLLFFTEYGPVLLLWALILFIPAWFVWRRWRRAAAAAV